MDKPLLKVCGLKKSFGGVEVLHSIDFIAEAGKVTALVGENGAGKSTLIKVLTGVEEFETGEIMIDGCDHAIINRSPQEAQNRGISTVYQEVNLCPNLTVAENLFIGREPRKGGLIDWKTMNKKASKLLQDLDIHADVTQTIDNYSIAIQQMVAIARAVDMSAKVLILDEPTSQLDPIAASDFLETVKKINRDLGTTIILTEHRLEEVFPSADRVVVMDEGQILCVGTPPEIGEELKKRNHEMFLAMPVPMQVYAKVESEQPCPITVRDGRKWLDIVCKKKGISPANASSSYRKESDSQKGKSSFSKITEKFTEKFKEKKEDIILACDDLWFRYDKELPDVVKGLSFSLKRGEFFALLGGNGTGKSTTLSLLSRLRKPYRGKVLLEGKDIRRYSDKELFRNFLGVLPQNPQSLFVKKSVELELFEMVGGVKEKKDEEYQLAMDKKDAVEGIIKVTHLEELLHRHPYDLSGGEQQRLALAKILLLRPKLLLMDEPTKGLDSYFKKEFAGILALLKEQGVTVFMISHDIEFCASYADRCGLFFDGNIVACGTPGEFFAGNNFYTTAANRMARRYFPMAVTGEDVVECLKKGV